MTFTSRLLNLCEIYESKKAYGIETICFSIIRRKDWRHFDVVD